MSDSDVKAPDSSAGGAELNGQDSKALQLAQELIRALDAESNMHMRQISEEDKAGKNDES